MTDTKATLGTGEALTQPLWSSTPMHIPNPGDGSFKTEAGILRAENGVEPESVADMIRAITGSDPDALLPDNGDKIAVIKLVWWHEPDARREPHNHPWPFKSFILSGGYKETITYVDESGNPTKAVERTYRAGDVNVVPLNSYHTVDEIEPGTATLMVCALNDDIKEWGYLIDNKHVRMQDAGVDETFFKRLCAINPHKRPKE